jgi:N-acetyl-anhydromuramyl-L-alanine amidase AmpD
MITIGMSLERRKIAEETMGKLVAHKMRTGEITLSTLIAAIIIWHPIISKKFHIYILEAEVERIEIHNPDYEKIRILNRHINAYCYELNYGVVDKRYFTLIAGQANANGIGWCIDLRRTIDKVKVFTDEQKFNKIIELLKEEAGIWNS